MRNLSLDGLRGLAAFNVVLFHFACAFYPHAVSEYDPVPWAIADTPLAIVYNGGFAVAVFFVLSGFVIATAAAQSRRPVLETLALRYLRLALPVTASVVVAWLLLQAFPGTVAILKPLIGSRWLDYVYDGDLPGLPQALGHGLAGVFVSGNSFYNNVLWTMKIELIGSWAIYVIYALATGRARLVLLAALLLAGLALLRPEYSAFAIGALMREAHAGSRLPRRFAWAALVFGLVVGATMQGYGQRIMPFADADVFGGVLRPGEPHKVWHVLAAAALIYAVLNLPVVARQLARRLPVFLGRISFGLYLVHVPILLTVMAGLYPVLPLTGAARILVLLALFVPLSVAAGHLFTLAVDEPVIGLLQTLKAQRRPHPVREG